MFRQGLVVKDSAWDVVVHALSGDVQKRHSSYVVQ